MPASPVGCHLQAGHCDILRTKPQGSVHGNQQLWDSVIRQPGAERKPMSPNSSHARQCLWVTRVLQTIHDLATASWLTSETEIKDQGDRQGWTNEAMISKENPRTVSLRRIMCFSYHNAASLFPHPSPREWAEVTFLEGRRDACLSIPATIKILVACPPNKITTSNLSSLRLEMQTSCLSNLNLQGLWNDFLTQESN